MENPAVLMFVSWPCAVGTCFGGPFPTLFLCILVAPFTEKRGVRVRIHFMFYLVLVSFDLVEY
jgi:hypothetical protein